MADDFLRQFIYLYSVKKIIVRILKHCIFVMASPTQLAPVESSRAGTQQR